MQRENAAIRLLHLAADETLARGDVGTLGVQFIERLLLLHQLTRLRLQLCEALLIGRRQRTARCEAFDAARKRCGGCIRGSADFGDVRVALDISDHTDNGGARFIGAVGAGLDLAVEGSDLVGKIALLAAGTARRIFDLIDQFAIGAQFSE